jgi:uncharacterized protein (UPF0297 family)
LHKPETRAITDIENEPGDSSLDLELTNDLAFTPKGGGRMPGEFEGTTSFQLGRDGKDKVAAILESVYKSLQEKGYNPVSQLVGYMISGDPAYITSYKDARTMICKVERDEILEVLIRNYLEG